MKWIIVITLLAIIRGVALPDYSWQPNIWLIPFVTPLVFAALATYISIKGYLNKLVIFPVSLLAIYISTVIGIIVYGSTSGWHYVFDDLESQAVFMATLGVQTITYLIAALAMLFAAKSYNKRKHK